MKPWILVFETVARALRLLRMTLQEIFEESAYQRFLTRHGMSSSREAYARFLHESEAIRERRPRCC